MMPPLARPHSMWVPEKGLHMENICIAGMSVVLLYEKFYDPTSFAKYLEVGDVVMTNFG